MRPILCAVTFACALLAQSQQQPLPDLKIEATDGGSALLIRNLSTSQALTAYLVELVDYPGSSFAFSQDEIALGGEPLPAGKQRRVPILNMTVGAAPDYMKMLAAIYADGSTAGSPEKVQQLVDRRRLYLTTIRDIIGKLEKKQGVRELREWASSIAESTSKTKRATPEVVNPATVKALVYDVASRLEKQGAETVIASLQASESALAASKPAL
jgi:hypothetical protein